MTFEHRKSLTVSELPYLHFVAVVKCIYNKMPLTSSKLKGDGTKLCTDLWNNVVAPQCASGVLNSIEVTAWLVAFLSEIQQKEVRESKDNTLANSKQSDEFSPFSSIIRDANEYVSLYSAIYQPSLLTQKHVEAKTSLDQFVSELNPYKQLPKYKAATLVCTECKATGDDYVRASLVQMSAADESWKVLYECHNPVHGTQPRKWRE